MNEEESLLSDVDNILKEAQEKEQESYVEYVRSVALNVEQTIHDEFGSLESYQLWTLNMAHKGTPESVADFKKERMSEDPSAVNVTVVPDDDFINSCLEMELAFQGQDGMPSDLNGLLDDKKAMSLIHAKRTNLVGFVARTGAWASKNASKSNKKPSKESDRLSITLTVYFASGMMVVIPREDETGKVMGDGVHVVHVFSPGANTKDDHQHSNVQVAESCAEYLEDKHGLTLAALYRAYAYPKAMMYDDPEMYKAITNDALSAVADEETQNNKEQ
jgi:hypothetical protein